MTKSNEIVVCGREDILSYSIELFLSAHGKWKVSNITYQEEINELIHVIETIQPEIVIIHQDFYKNSMNIPMQLLHDHPGIMVIMVSLENNLMEVYSKEQIRVREVSDLISVIESKPSKKLLSDVDV